MYAGQAAVVKLFPKLLSNGDGSGVFASPVEVTKRPLDVVDANVEDD